MTDIELRPGSGATRESQDDHAYVEAILRTMRQPLVVLDGALTVERANRAFYAAFAVAAAETEGRKIYDLGNGQWDIPELRRLLEDILPRSGEVTDYRVEHDFEQVGRRVMILNACRMKREGCDDRILLSIDDRTEIGDASARLEKSEAGFRAFVSASSDVMYRMSGDWSEMRFLDGRGFLSDTTETSEDWLRRYIHADDQPTVLAAIRKAIEGREVFALEHRVLRADGTLGWTESRAVPILDPAGGIVEWFGTASDITARRDAEEKLRESQERQAFLLTLSDALRPLVDPLAIMTVASEHTGRHFAVGRCGYAELLPPYDEFVVASDWTNGVMPSLQGRWALAQFGDAFVATHRAGQTVVVDDALNDRRAAGVEDALKAAGGVRASIAVPLVKGGNWVAAFYVQDNRVHRWTQSDVVLMEEIAQRTWAAIERARAEAALRESEERFRQFGDHSADTLWIVNVGTGRLEYLSSAYETMWGESRERVMADIGRWAELLHPDDRDQASQAMGRAASGTVFQQVYRIRRPRDGAVRVIQDTGFPIRDLTGRVARIGGVAQDVTEQKQAEERMRQSEERLRSAVEVGKLGLWDWNLETGDIHWSDQHFRLEGYEVGEVTPSYQTWADRLHPADRAETEAALHLAKDSGAEYEREFRVVHPDGSVRWLHARGRFFYDGAGRPLRMVGAMTDTTRRREMEEHQKVLIAELQHRTMNLISVVRSVAERTAQHSADIADFRAHFRDRLQALARVQRLLSRLDDHDRVSFDELLDAEFSALGGSGQRLTLQGPSGVLLRSSTVQTLAMALHELATNAVKYGALGQPAGRLAVTWSFEPPAAEAEPWLHIDWRESGVAMPPDGSEPQGTGHGRDLIERALPYQLKATTTYTLGPDGVRCTISIPVSKRTRAEGAHAGL